eukprot:15347536-Ditylum_brightwellii.AAC.1
MNVINPKEKDNNKIHNIRVSRKAQNASQQTNSRKALVNFNNDVASCYNWIIPSLANHIRRTKGLHRNIMFVHANKA